jgi:hypothetical protein
MTCLDSPAEPWCLDWAQAQQLDNMTSLIDERDREVQNIVASINELAQVGCALDCMRHWAELCGWL